MTDYVAAWAVPGDAGSSAREQVLPGLGFGDQCSISRIDLHDATLNSLTLEQRSLPAYDRVGGLLVNEGEEEPGLGVELAKAEQLQGIHRHLPFLAPLQLANSCQDLDEDRVVRCRTVRLNPRVAQVNATLMLELDPELYFKSFEHERLGSELHLR